MRKPVKNVMRGLIYAAFLLGAIGSASPAWAQGTTGSISGTIVNESKGVMPGVTIRVKNVETGQEQTQVSDGQGRYRVPNLPPGSYIVTAELPGFAPAKREGVTVTIGQDTLVDVELKVPQEPKPDTKPDGFMIGGYNFKVGGRVKLDIIRDFDPIGSEDSFDPRTIPLDDSEGGNSQLHARETRLFLDMRGPIEGKELKMYVETDFYGSGSVFRLRHAYGSWGGLLAGQTWTTFLDENNFPSTIDFESPMAFPSFRQAQVRWTQKLGANASWSAAVEDNKSTIEPPEGVPGKAEYSMPDLVTNFRYGASRGHAFASAFLGKARFRPEEGDPDNEMLWGMLLSGRFKIGKDAAYAQYTFGEGVGRYRGALTAVPDANGRLHAPGLNAFMAGYEHYWNDRLSSNAVFSVAVASEEDFYPGDFNKQLDYGAINLLYWFLKDRAWAGVEYLYGGREVFDERTGSANRLQFAVRFNFPS